MHIKCTQGSLSCKITWNPLEIEEKGKIFNRIRDENFNEVLNRSFHQDRTPKLYFSRPELFFELADNPEIGNRKH